MVSGDLASSAGLVYIFHDDIWGTVCDDLWDDVDASVVCRSLGFNAGGVALPGGAYQSEIGQIWLDNVECEGDEDTLEDCPSLNYGIHDCIITENAGVRCLSTGSVINITS